MENFDAVAEYDKAMDRVATIDAILALDKRFTREYLNTLTIDGLHDLEDACLDKTHETP